MGPSSAPRHQSHELDPVSIWMSQGSDFTAQVCASPLPLPQHLGPKAARIKRPLLATLSGPLLHQGRHAGVSASSVCGGPGKDRIMTPIFNYPHSRSASQVGLWIPTFPAGLGDGRETCSLQKLSNQAECKAVTSRRQGQRVTANLSPPPRQTMTSRSLPHPSTKGSCGPAA